MDEGIAEGRKRFFISALLALQASILWISLGEWEELSPFCTVVRASDWAWVAHIHFAFAALLLLGFASIFWARLRVWYVVLLCLGLSVLPLQAWLVEQGKFTCDGP